MAKRILVPLDRSLAAESVLPIAAQLAHGAGATVRLIHVAADPHGVVDEKGRVVVYVDQEVASAECAAMDYLRPLEAHFRPSPVDSVVRFGDPVAEVLREAESFDADLIVVGSMGRSGMLREACGSVAEDLLRRAHCPVLLYSVRFTYL
jgi:glycine betaine transporter